MIQHHPNFIQGSEPKQITTLRELDEACKDGRAVVLPSVSGLGKPRAAAFFMSMQARLVLRYLTAGMFIYTPKKKTNP